MLLQVTTPTLLNTTPARKIYLIWQKKTDLFLVPFFVDMAHEGETNKYMITIPLSVSTLQSILKKT
jgi:hypothetical protein